MVWPNEDFVKQATEATPAKRAVSSHPFNKATMDGSTGKSAPIPRNVVAKTDGTNLALGSQGSGDWSGTTVAKAFFSAF